jgi:hypothetical protein
MVCAHCRYSIYRACILLDNTTPLVLSHHPRLQQLNQPLPATPLSPYIQVRLEYWVVYRLYYAPDQQITLLYLIVLNKSLVPSSGQLFTVAIGTMVEHCVAPDGELAHIFTTALECQYRKVLFARCF